MSAAILAPAFTYDGLPTGLTGDLKRAATRVRELIGDQKKSIVETGKVFLAVKEKIEHGKFLVWAEAECAVTPRTVQRYMQVAEMMAGKYDIVSYLEPTALYLLAAPSTPGEVRREIFDRAAKGEKVRVAQIKAFIRDARPRLPSLAPAAVAPPSPHPEPLPEPTESEPKEDDYDDEAPDPKVTEALDAHRAAIKRLNPAQKERFWGELGYIKRPALRKVSRPERWQNAIAEIEELQSEYQNWLDSMPENLQDSTKAEQLQAIIDIDLTELQDVAFSRMMG